MKKYDSVMKGDLKLAIMALCQPVLTIFQGLLILYGITSEEESTLVRAALSAVLVFVALPVMLKRKPSLFITSFVLIGMFVVFELVAFPINRTLIVGNSFRWIFPILVPSFLAIPCMRRPVEAIDKGLFVISWLIAIESVFFIFVMFSSGLIGVKYDMGTGFSILVAAIYFVTRQKFKYYVISLFLISIILVATSRSPILAMALFTGYYFLIEKRKSKTAILIIPLLAILIVLIKPILLYAQSMGIESRTIVMFLEGDIENSAGRDFIYPIILKSIEDNPIFGIGIYGDRTLYASDDLATSYAHNLFLEMWVDYGVIFGTLFLIIIFIIPLILIWKLRQDVRIIFMVIAVGCLIPLLFSGSYLLSPLFATYMGFCYYIFKNKKALKSEFKYIKK